MSPPDTGTADLVRADTREISHVPETSAGAVLTMIADAATNPAVSVEKMAGLMDLQDRALARDALAAFNRDFIALEAVLPRIKKGGKVEYPKNKNDPTGPKEKAFAFAKFEDIDTIVRPLMRDHGFSISFDSGMREGGGLVVTGRLLHRGGHSKEATVPLSIDASGGKNNLQGVGSSISYGKRYAVTMLLNLVFEGEDDDGVRGGMRFITDAQKDELVNLMQETRANTTDFLHFLDVRSLDEIEVKVFPVAKNMLLAKRRKVSSGGQP